MIDGAYVWTMNKVNCCDNTLATTNSLATIIYIYYYLLYIYLLVIIIYFICGMNNTIDLLMVLSTFIEKPCMKRCESKGLYTISWKISPFYAASAHTLLPF